MTASIKQDAQASLKDVVNHNKQLPTVEELKAHENPRYKFNFLKDRVIARRRMEAVKRAVDSEIEELQKLSKDAANQAVRILKEIRDLHHQSTYTKEVRRMEADELAEQKAFDWRLPDGEDDASTATQEETAEAPKVHNHEPSQCHKTSGVVQ